MKIVVTDRSGVDHVIEGIAGWRLMEIIRDYGMRDPSLAIKAECGGACACATCHVYVDPLWQHRLAPKTAEEEERLDDAFEVSDRSRLSCQILMQEELDGLKVALAPGSEP